MPEKDPVGEFLNDLVGDIFGSSKSGRGEPSKPPKSEMTVEDRTRTFFPATAAVAVVVIVLWWLPRGFASDTVANSWSDAARWGDWLTMMRPRLIGLVIVAAVVDVIRLARRRHKRVFAAITRQVTGHPAKQVRLAPMTFQHSTSKATIKLPAGSVIDEKQAAKLGAAVGALLTSPPPSLRLRARVASWVIAVTGGRAAEWLGGRITRWTVPGEYRYHTAYTAAAATITVTRERVPVDNRSERHRMLASLLGDDKVLQDVAVSVAETDDGGSELAYRISYKHTLATGVEANRTKLSEALLASLGEHESGQMWRVDWDKSAPVITVSLRARLPKMAVHSLPVAPQQLPELALDARGIGAQDMAWPTGIAPVAAAGATPTRLLKDPVRMGRRLHVPYATCETDEGLKDAFWNISDRSSAPHMLVVGPTGGGKTVLLTTVITELVLRGVPVIGVDPKRIELHQFLGYPGVPAIVFDPLRAALLIAALHAEMMARTKYMQTYRIKPKNMPLLVAVLDEFFILSAAWTQLAKSGSDREKEILKTANPLGKIGELVALARSTGIRLAVGVQRPDAHLFGRDSGGVRDNFRTRASLARLSSDGSYMLWADTNVGRDIDAQIPGRATVTDAAGDPTLAQVWYTPSVDEHPAVRGEMDDAELAAVTSLLPTGDTPVYCFGDELPAFLADEQALIEVMGDDVRDPVAVTSRGVAGASQIADRIDDAVPARGLETGMSIVVEFGDDESGDGDSTVIGTVLSVDVPDQVTEDSLVRVEVEIPTDGARAEVLLVDYGAFDTVPLAAAELAAA